MVLQTVTLRIRLSQEARRLWEELAGAVEMEGASRFYKYRLLLDLRHLLVREPLAVPPLVFSVVITVLEQAIR
jgi:hypothetical protein